MGFACFFKVTLFFISGFYFGYKYNQVLIRYDEALQSVQRIYHPEDNNSDNDSNSSISFSHPSGNREPEFSSLNETSSESENSGEAGTVKISRSSDKSSDSDKSSNNEYMRSAMSALNQFRPTGHSTDLSSNDDELSVISNEKAGSSQTPIRIQDSDDSNVPGSSSIMGTITGPHGIPLGVIMVSRQNDEYNSHMVESSDESNSSDNESHGDSDPCERYNCFA